MDTVEYFPVPASLAPLDLPFSEAVRVESMLYLSGAMGIDSAGRLVPGGIVAETRQALANIRAVLERHGSSMDRVIKCTAMLADMQEWTAMNRVYVEHFPTNLPARSAFGASGRGRPLAVHGPPRMSTSDPLSEDFQFRALMENTEDSIYFKDRACRLLRVSRRMADSLGFSDVSELVGKTDIDLFGESFGQRTFMEDLRIMESNEPIIGLVESRPVGQSETNWTLTTKVPLHDASGNVVGLLGITREINELKRTEHNLQHLATHDSLTGLPNRYLMIDRLSQTQAHSERTGTIFAVLFVDVDDFKAINDARGHEFGDLVLRALGGTLVSTVRSSDTVARIGGDEFVIILETLGRREDASLVADKILRSVVKPFTLKRHKVNMTVSIGISVHPDNGGDAEVLLRAADYAMYLAKSQGKNRSLVCPQGLPGSGKTFRAG